MSIFNYFIALLTFTVASCVRSRGDIYDQLSSLEDRLASRDDTAKRSVEQTGRSADGCIGSLCHNLPSDYMKKRESRDPNQYLQDLMSRSSLSQPRQYDDSQFSMGGQQMPQMGQEMMQDPQQMMMQDPSSGFGGMQSDYFQPSMNMRNDYSQYTLAQRGDDQFGGQDVGDMVGRNGFDSQPSYEGFPEYRQENFDSRSSGSLNNLLQSRYARMGDEPSQDSLQFRNQYLPSMPFSQRDDDYGYTGRDLVDSKRFLNQRSSDDDDEDDDDEDDDDEKKARYDSQANFDNYRQSDDTSYPQGYSGMAARMEDALSQMFPRSESYDDYSNPRDANFGQDFSQIFNRLGTTRHDSLDSGFDEMSGNSDSEESGDSQEFPLSYRSPLWRYA